MNEQDYFDEKGSITILAAGAAIALLGFAALAIDVGLAVTTRTQLQNVADTGAMSGARELARIYDEKGNVNYQKYTLTAQDKARIVANINEFSKANKAAGVSVAIPASDVIFGRYNAADGTITPTDTGVDSVAVAGRRDGTANGSVNTLLAGVMGVDSMNIRATAGTAGVSATSAVPSGWADIPVGIARAWFTAHDSPCGTDSTIRFYPTNSTLGCSGWHVFTEPVASASRLRNILNGMREGWYKAPAIVANQTKFNFTGGTVSSDFDEMERLYHSKKDATGTWLVNIPVYDRSDCSNPSGEILIIGLATARIYKVDDKDKIIEANVECDVAPIGKGGGEFFGTATAVQAKVVQ